jgi:16S rRNA processing protein RimM
MPNSENNDLVVMGKVIGAFGIQGAIKVRTDNSNTATSLSQYKTIQLLVNNQWKSYKIKTSAPHENVVNIKLTDINDRDIALGLKGSDVAVSRLDFPKIKDSDEYYWVDLINLTVVNTDNINLGLVTNLMESGANSVLVVEGEQKHLIPFVAAYVLNVDIPKKQILVDWGMDY